MGMSRKRNYNDVDDFHRSSSKLPKISLSIEEKLETLIKRVGDESTVSLENNLKNLANVLEEDLSTYKAKILNVLVEYSIKMPEKCTIYTTLIGLLNASNYGFGGECVELLTKSLRESLKSCKWDEARYIVRFLSDLVNCHVITASSLMELFNNFVEAALEEGVPQVRRDWFAFAVLYALPWVGRELYEKRESELDRILGSIESYIKRRPKYHHAALKVLDSDEPHSQDEYLDCLWQQIKRLRHDLWIEKHIVRYYVAFDSNLCGALQHPLPKIRLPPHHPSTSYPLPRVIFRMFDYTDCPEGPILPGQYSIERYLIEDELLYILQLYHSERSICAAKLLDYPLKGKVPLEYMIVEMIFGEMFSLPNAQFIEICYGSVLIELCKLKTGTIPQVLAQTTELLYERINHMKISCFDKFVTWFAYHLSNFQFRWSWEDWTDALSCDPNSPKPRFIREVLLKSMRLSYHNRIVEVTPKEFAVLIPDVPSVKFRYETSDIGDEQNPDVVFASKLIEAMKAKSKDDELLEIINQIPDAFHTQRFSAQKIDIFVQSLLSLGHKTISHSFAAISKYHGILKLMGDSSEEAQICILRSVYDLWYRNQQMILILVDKMLKYRIVECSSVANWIFSKEMTPNFVKSFVWEILHLTIRKMNRHVNKLCTDASNARKLLDDGCHSSSSSSDDVSDSEFDHLGGNFRRRRKSQRKRDINRNEDDGPKPTEEEVEKMEEILENVQADQKNLFLIIFQRFIMVLSEHLVRCDTDGVDFRSSWYNCAIGRLQQVFLIHHEQVEKYSSTLETLLFTNDLDPHILDVFQQFVALRI